MSVSYQIHCISLKIWNNCQHWVEDALKWHFAHWNLDFLEFRVVLMSYSKAWYVNNFMIISWQSCGWKGGFIFYRENWQSFSGAITRQLAIHTNDGGDILLVFACLAKSTNLVQISLIFKCENEILITQTSR